MISRTLEESICRIVNKLYNINDIEDGIIIDCLNDIRQFTNEHDLINKLEHLKLLKTQINNCHTSILNEKENILYVNCEYVEFPDFLDLLPKNGSGVIILYNLEKTPIDNYFYKDLINNNEFEIKSEYFIKKMGNKYVLPNGWKIQYIKELK